MKSSQVILFLFVLFLTIFVLPLNAISNSSLAQTNDVPLWLVLHFQDYNTGMPVSNMSVSATIYTDRGQKIISSVLTNDTGVIQVLLGYVSKTTSYTNKRLQEIRLSPNYTLIKIQGVFVEDSTVSTQSYTADYYANTTRHTGLLIDLNYKNLGDRHFIEGNISVLKGRLVRVLDSDPFTGKKVNLIISPAIKTNIPTGISDYESYYLFPLNYEVTIYHRITTYINYQTGKTEYEKEPISPFRVKVNENTTLVNWMAHAAEEYASRQTINMDKELAWLSSSGYPLDRENEQYNAIKGLLERVMELYRKEEYIAALGGARISVLKMAELERWISDIKILAILNTIGISLFAYGLATLLASFILEEPSENKARLGIKVLSFSLIMLMFSLSHPSLKITFAQVIGSQTIDLPISLLGCFIFGGLTYFFIQLISIRKKTMTDLAVQLGVRSLKRRRSRTLLTLVTITIMVSSAIIFVNITVNRSTEVKEQWKGTSTAGVLIKPDILQAPLSQYDINWTNAQLWCKELAYTEGIRTSEVIVSETMSRSGILFIGGEVSFVDIVGIDPTFMQKHFALSEQIRGFWEEFAIGKPVVILPTTLGVLPNEDVTLGVQEAIGMSTTRRTFGRFHVIGTFDPRTAFVDLVNIDNKPLFGNPSRMVLIPLRSIKDQAITISEATVLIRDGNEPFDVAKELAYMLAATTIANKDGLAQRINWSVEFSVAGLIPYVPPLIIAGLMMYTTMVSVYEERRREFTTLATLGLDPRNTLQVFIVEALLLGLMGTFIGFFGSYLLGAILFYSTTFLRPQGVPVSSLLFTHWSMPSILVAFLTGVVMVFLGGYIPAMRTQGLSLMGRVKKREMVGELVSEGGVVSFALPIRETIQNGEMLYTYIRETMGKLKESHIDPHSIKGEMYRDGTFRVAFVILGDGSQVTVPCEIKGVKDGEDLLPVIEFPTSYRSYRLIREILRDLESYMIGFSAWKEMQLKMTIIREAPKKTKSIEEIMASIKVVIDQIKDCNKKLKILESQKGKLSDEVYNEFREKYINLIEEKEKNLRSMTVNLEPYHKQLHEEINKVEIEVERITTAYNLGEVTEEEYVKTCGPLQGRLAELKSKVLELEEIFEFLKKPLGMMLE